MNLKGIIWWKTQVHWGCLELWSQQILWEYNLWKELNNCWTNDASMSACTLCVALSSQRKVLRALLGIACFATCLYKSVQALAYCHIAFVFQCFCVQNAAVKSRLALCFMRTWLVFIYTGLLHGVCRLFEWFYAGLATVINIVLLWVAIECVCCFKYLMASVCARYLSVR